MFSPPAASHTSPIKDDGACNNPSNKRPSLFQRTARSAKKREAADEIRGPLGLRSLFSSPEPLVDFVFVHGLGGGSKKTFCKDNDPELFWPERWLPNEPEFSSASVYSFGYDSDWGSSKPSSLTVHDFGRSLYEELQTSPLLRHNSKNRPIILIGHSMGGLVVKKAYILAQTQEDQAGHKLSNRIKSIFFLATPHRGSDYANLLNGALGTLSLTKLTSSKDYVNDLRLDSVSMQQINEDFARLAIVAELTIYTFFEIFSTIPITSTLIVKKGSAVLGSNTNEHIQYLEANHRDICKFSSMNDSNYIRVKNSLGTAVENLLENVFVSNENNRTVQLETIREALAFPDLPEEHHDILEGSCHWIEDREDFQQWGNPEIEGEKSKSYQAEVFWVQAQPGAGKTVLAAHVAARLAEDRLPFSSYFFQYGNTTCQTLSGFVLSLAYQMATTNAGVREKLAQLCKDGAPLHYDSAYTMWTRVFVGGIFQVPITAPQFWVVDGLDECINSHEFSRMLNGTQIYYPLRIFVTSRKLPNMQEIIDQLTRCKTTVLQIPVDDTMRDIDLYISKRIGDLPVDREEEQAELANKIRTKCSACFLWVRLVLDELEGVYGYETITQVLEEMPEGMLSYYKRAVTEMAGKREVSVAKAILGWTVLAVRPLSVLELSNAIEHDLKIKLSRQKRAIEGLCGQMVAIDPNTDLVQVVHATAREFLMSDEAGDFQISRSQGHEAMAVACIATMLKCAAMIPPRSHSLEVRPGLASPALLNYATIYFSEHVLAASTSSNRLLQELCNFLQKSVLKWIEIVVMNNGVHILIRTAKDLKGYLERRQKDEPPAKSLARTIDGWATDLSRVSAKFGRALTSSPQSIFFLIPPLCPTQSTIYQQYLSSIRPNGLTISGPPYTEWDDCIAHIHFEDETATAIASGNGLIAVGMESGNVILYNSQGYQNQKVLRHGAKIDLVKFDTFGSFLVASSTKLVTVWELDGTLRWETRIRSRCILLSSSQTVLIGVTQHGRSYQWDIMTGELLEEQSYLYQAPNSVGDSHPHMGKAPSSASLSPGLDLLALTYRNSPVCIFEFGSGNLVSWIVDENSRAAEQIVFNPDPEVGLLAVAYNESHLALYEPWSGSLITSFEAERPAIISSMTCAPDGQTFATVDNLGHLRIWDFESLALLYHVLTPATSFSLLEFTSDASNLVNLGDHEMRIWAPSALVRKTMEEEASISEEASAVMTTTEGQYEQFQASKINMIVVHPKISSLFAGNYHGDVLAYSSQNGYQPTALYSHGNAGIKCLAVSSNELLAVADTNANLQIRRPEMSPAHTGVKTTSAVFETNFSTPVSLLLFDESGAYILVSTLNRDYVYRIIDGSLVGTLEVQPNTRKIWKWIIAPSSIFRGQFLLVADHKLVSYSTENFPAVAFPEPFPLAFQIGEGSIETAIDSFVFHPETSAFILEIRQQRGFNPHSTTFIFEVSASTSLPTLHTLPSLPQNIVKRFLGINQTTKRLMFLSHESWVCSVDPKDLLKPLQRYTQHFLVPDEYVPTNGEVPPIQTVDGDFAFCLFDKVVVVRNGLKFQTVKEIVGVD